MARTESQLVSTPDVASDALGDVYARINAVLQHHATSRWLKAALGSALDRDPVEVLDDPVEVLDDADVLRELLAERAAAVVDRMIDATA